MRFSVSSIGRIASSCLFLVMGALLPLCSLALYNYTLDPHGVFGGSDAFQTVRANYRYRKIQYLLDKTRETEYEPMVLMFGNSRVEKIPTHEFYGDLAYNVSYRNGLPKDHLLNLQLLLSRGLKIEKVYIGIDEFSVRLHPEFTWSRLPSRPHPLLSLQSAASFYADYLLRVPTERTDNAELNGTLAYLICDYQKVQPHSRTTGLLECDSCERWIDEHPDEHRRVLSRHQAVNFSPSYGIKEVTADIKAIADLLKEHNVALVLFFNPSHYYFQYNVNLINNNEFKRQVASVSPFFDFGGIHELSLDLINYFDHSHYRTHIGRLMMETMIKGDEIRQGFGQWIDKDNIEQHLNMLTDQVKQYPKLHQKYIIDRDIHLSDQRSRQRISSLAQETTGTPPLYSIGQKRCHIDTVGSRRVVSGKPLSIDKTNYLEVKGWIHARAGSVELIGAQYRLQKAFTPVIERPGVQKRFGEPGLKHGFTTMLDIRSLATGPYRLKLKTDAKNGSEPPVDSCQEDVLITLESTW